MGQKQSIELLLEFGSAKGLPSFGAAKGLSMEKASYRVSWFKAQMRPKSRVRVRVRIGRNGRNVLCGVAKGFGLV